MAFKGVEKWHLLPYSTSTHHVPFFFKFSSDSVGFKLLVTNLSSVWEQIRSRSQICQDAFTSETCSIDPGEDPSQYDVLLDKLRLSLSGQDGGRNRLHLASERLRELKIVSSLPLPVPLSPLTWTFNLESPLDGFSMRRELMSPALEAIASKDEQIRSLKQHLKDKDRVISRLMDRIESSGIDLPMVFPGLTNARSSKKKLDGAQAAKSVAGLAPFNEEEWNETQDRKGTERYGSVHGLLDAMNSSVPTSQKASNEDIALGDGMSQRTAKKRQHRDSVSSSGTSTATASGSETSDSQQHRASVSRKPQPRKSEGGESSTSSKIGIDALDKVRKQKRPTSPKSPSSTDSDTNSASDSPALSKPTTRKSPPRRRLGAIGKRETQPRPPSASVRKTRIRSPDVPLAAPSSNTSTPSRRLGQIGDRSSSRLSTKSPHPSPSSSTPTCARPPRKSPSPTSPHSAPKRSRPRPSPSPSLSPVRKPKAKQQPPKRETEDEKIARKREEVQRLERGPVKKKGRKF